MNDQQICPFYGQNPEQCDVGYGYISPYHVEVLVRHCTSHYAECGKYKTLTTRPAPQRTLDASAERPPAEAPAGGLVFPLPLEREVVSAVQHAIRTPLTSIRSFTEILLQYPIDDPEAQRRFLHLIAAEAERLGRAVELIFGPPKAPTAQPRAKGYAGRPALAEAEPPRACQAAGG